MKTLRFLLTGVFDGRKEKLRRATVEGFKLAIVLASACLVAFLITPTDARAQNVSDIYTFTGNNSSAIPLAVTPAQGRDGWLYGTTYGLGGIEYGTIFKVAATGTFKQLYTFNGTNGSLPNAGVSLARDGNFYGTTLAGGNAGFGVLFRISSGGTYTVLHNFAGGEDGVSPASPPVQGFDGNLYGTTSGNTATSSTVYKYTPTSGAFATIYQFDQPDGSSATPSLIQAANGNFYGTASQGGASNCGTIFELTISGTLLWEYSFPCLAGGANPVGPLIQGTDRNFYGTTSQGGSYNVGTVFELDQNGIVSILYSFQSFFNGGADGSTPFGGLVQATDAKLYGSTLAGGTQNQGTLFQISTTGAYKVLYSFGNTGNGPQGTIMQDTSGLLYGTTFEGGKDGFGVVYSLNMRLAQFVSLVGYTGRAGSTVQILGQGFSGTTGVTFNGVAASIFHVVSNTYMTAVVPSGATAGAVVVTTPSGPLRSNKNFQIIGGGTNAARPRSYQAISQAAMKRN